MSCQTLDSAVQEGGNDTAQSQQDSGGDHGSIGDRMMKPRHEKGYRHPQRAYGDKGPFEVLHPLQAAPGRDWFEVFDQIRSYGG